MEDIHNVTLKLKKLILDTVHLIEPTTGVTNSSSNRRSLLDSRGSKISIKPVNTVEYLCITLDVLPADLEDGSSNALIVTKWLVYIGRKYNRLNYLDVKTSYDKDQVEYMPAFEQHILDIVTNLKSSLTHFNVRVFPMSADILIALDSSNGAKLENVNLFMDGGNEGMEEQFQALQS